MTAPITIALDAMGGDNAPAIVVKGANIVRERFPDVRFVFYGDKKKISSVLSKKKKLKEVSKIVHTDIFIPSDMKPSLAFRSSKGSSMRLAIEAVKEGKAHAAVSAGNTGALMAISKTVLKTLPGIDRPAMAALVPTDKGESVVLDLGANTECDHNNLVQFAIMGEVFCRTILGIKRPTVGLLNIGSEEVKGRTEIRQAAEILTEIDLPLDFQGFIEGDDLMHGAVDVVVADGFTGNIALKTLEGTAKFAFEAVRKAFKTSLSAKLAYLIARPAIRRMKARLDPRRYNGAVFLGLNGISIKSHGGADPLGYANAITLGIDMARHGFIEQTHKEVAHIAPKMAEALNGKAA
ncbi:MAG: phosphate acyltransferase PlsX [Alphaproteobacteria bacterium]